MASSTVWPIFYIQKAVIVFVNFLVICWRLLWFPLKKHIVAWFNYEANRFYSSDKFALGGRSQTLHLGRWKRAKSRSWWERTKDASGSYCFQFKSSGKQIRLISILFLSQQSFSRMIAFIRLAMGMNNTHRKFLVVLTEEILCQSDRITNSVFPYATTL